jgi:hypothetical protein
VLVEVMPGIRPLEGRADEQCTLDRR